MSDEDLMRSFSVSNPLSLLVEGTKPSTIDTKVFDETLKSLERAIAVATTREMELVTAFPTAHNTAQRAEIGGVLRNIRGFGNLLASKLTATHSLGHELACRVGDLLQTHVAADLGQQANSLRSAIAQMEPLDATELGNDLLRAVVNFRSYTLQIRKLFIVPLLDTITGVQADVDGPVQIEAQGTLAHELANLQETRVAQLAHSAEQSAANARRSSGAAAGHRQHATFDATAASAQSGARFWTGCAFLLIFAGLAIPPATLLLDSHSQESYEWVPVLLKFLIALPLYGAAAYAARIASQHREFGRHMELMAVQVDTIESFIEPMDATGQSEIRGVLGRRLFAPIEMSAKDTGHISVIPAELIPLLERVMDRSTKDGSR